MTSFRSGSAHGRVNLVCRSFLPGGIVHGSINLPFIHTDAGVKVEWIAAQLHGHVSVDTDVLTVPMVKTPMKGYSRQESEELCIYDVDLLPNVKSFSDGPSGTCLFLSKAKILASDCDLPIVDRKFALRLPHKLCPSFRGSAAQVFYLLSITVKTSLKEKPIILHIPIDVLGTEFHFEDLLREEPGKQEPLETEENSSQRAKYDRLRAELGRNTEQLRPPRAVQRGLELAGVKVSTRKLHGRDLYESQNAAKTSQFIIGKKEDHLVRLSFFKQRYAPGETILMTCDFSKSHVPCVQISAALVLAEKLASLAHSPGTVVREQVVAENHTYTANSRNTHISLVVPHESVRAGGPRSLPLGSLTTDLICFEWMVRFEFVLGSPPASGVGPRDSLTGADIASNAQRATVEEAAGNPPLDPTTEKYSRLEWSTKIIIDPTVLGPYPELVAQQEQGSDSTFGEVNIPSGMEKIYQVEKNLVIV